MPETERATRDEDVVRHYLDALGNGQVLDALNTFSMDVRLRDEEGRERRGIREIAAAFVNRGRPVKLDVEKLERQGEAVAVQIGMTSPETGERREYRSMFRISRNRIRSLEMEPIPAHHAARRRQGQST